MSYQFTKVASLLGLLITIVQSAAAQEPLFIDKEGNVYIKVKEGNKKFSVAGMAEFLDGVKVNGPLAANQLTATQFSVTGTSTLGDSVKLLGRLLVDGNSYVRSNSTVIGTSFLNGNVGIGVPSSADASLLFHNVVKNRKIVLWNAGNDHQFYGFGIQQNTLRYQVDVPASSHVFYAGTAADNSRELMRIKGDGRVTIGTAAGDASTKGVLEVKGDLVATTINGEKTPYQIEINPSNVTGKRHSVQVPSDIIKSYLGDYDGGTITIIMRNITNSTTTDTRLLSERIYIRPPLANGTIGGYTRQLAGGEKGFTLNSNGTDMLPGNWGWIWMRNYHSRDTDPKTDGPPWRGNDAYRVEFFTTENISATVIIYDR